MCNVFNVKTLGRFSQDLTCKIYSVWSRKRWRLSRPLRWTSHCKINTVILTDHLYLIMTHFYADVDGMVSSSMTMLSLHRVQRLTEQFDEDEINVLCYSPHNSQILTQLHTWEILDCVSHCFLSTLSKHQLSKYL